MAIPVYILAGGKNSRFGSDKARAVVRGQPMLLHASQALSAFASRVTVVADIPDKYEDLGLRTIADHLTGRGPLGGLHRALQDVGDDEDWLLLTSCDLLGVQPEWIELLLSHRDCQGGVIAFRGEHWEPLPALYRARLLRQTEDLASRSSPPVWHLIEQAEPLPLPLPDNWGLAAQINTVQALQAYESRL